MRVLIHSCEEQESYQAYILQRILQPNLSIIGPLNVTRDPLRVSI